MLLCNCYDNAGRYFLTSTDFSPFLTHQRHNHVVGMRGGGRGKRVTTVDLCIYFLSQAGLEFAGASNKNSTSNVNCAI